tara:strand:+ start:438 stop:722 length:285 start_codon:yes stop_codon:yes gene_type:complete
MYLLTKKEGDLESGAYASVDDDGTPIVQFFVNKDDAITYNTMLEALDQDISVTEIDGDAYEKFCSVIGHAYTVIEEGEIVIPKLETLTHTLIDS